MATVSVLPMPASFRDIPRRLRPGHPPIFPDGNEPTPADVALALDLFAALDVESFEWYGGTAAVERLRARLTHHDA